MVHEYVVPHAEHRVRERVLAGDGSMGSARSDDVGGASQYSVQSLASTVASFASFTVANAGGAPLPPTAAAASAAPGIVVAPRRSADAGAYIVSGLLADICFTAPLTLHTPQASASCARRRCRCRRRNRRRSAVRAQTTHRCKQHI
jgi:hypothetical protein